MSFDVMIIDPTTVPTTTHAEFMTWYEETTEWNSERDYTTTDGSTDAIAEFYNAITQHFPDLNAADDLDEADQDDEDDEDEFDDDAAADYTIGNDFIYISIDSEYAENAAQRCLNLAHANNLALVDVSATSTISMPNGETIAP